MSAGAEPFRFHCAACGAWHEGMPSFAAPMPDYCMAMPAADRAKRCVLTSDICVVDETHRFVRGCVEIPVLGSSQAFVWGLWVSLSEASFATYRSLYENRKRSHAGPFFGFLANEIGPYQGTLGLKTNVHLRDDGMRPLIELEPTDHPLALEQVNGISDARVAELYAFHAHGTRTSG